MPGPLLNAEFWRNKKVLITGHTGFKGSWLGLWLNELGAKVTGIGMEPDTEPSLFTQLKLEDRIHRHQIADIREFQAVKTAVEACEPEIVLHLAAQPLVRQSYIDPLGTWNTNVQGSLNLLEALKSSKKHCAVVMVTTDKVYLNQEWDYGYRESDRLGGHDPYSASKAAAELAIASWRESFCGEGRHQTTNLSIATARAGNVIGGGDWATDRIMPDAIRSLAERKPIAVRNPKATRPWQHVLEPLGGYLLLAERLMCRSQQENRYTDAFNFGPSLEDNRTVEDLVEEIIKYWEGAWNDASDQSDPHEAKRLHLHIDKAHHQLGWRPRWKFRTTVERTVKWYKQVQEGRDALSLCMADIYTYQKQI